MCGCPGATNKSNTPPRRTFCSLKAALLCRSGPLPAFGGTSRMRPIRRPASLMPPPGPGGGARHSVRPDSHAETSPIRLVLGRHGAHRVTRPTPGALLSEVNQPAALWLDGDWLVWLPRLCRLEVLYLRSHEPRLAPVQTQRLPVDLEAHFCLLWCPTGQRNEGLAGLDVSRRQDVRPAGANRTIRLPPAHHPGSSDAELIPYLPDGARIGAGPRQPGGHAEEHPAPAVAAILEHVAHEPEGNAAALDEPLLGRHRVVFEALAEPEPVHVREELGVLIGRPLREERVRVQVNQATGPRAVDPLAHAQEDRPVVGPAIAVAPVDWNIAGEPVDALDVKVIPARRAAGEDRGVRNSAFHHGVPGRRVVAAQVFAQPREPAARAVRQHFIAQAAQGPQLGQMRGQFADGVIDLHLLASRLIRVTELAQLVHRQEWIVDERVRYRGVVEVDNVYVWRDVVRAVPIALAEMRCGLERLHRRNENG